MSVTVRRVESRKDLVEFVEFPIRLYKGVPYYVPSLVIDELATLNPAKNPASEFCTQALFLAKDEKGKTVGRVAAIINSIANRDWNHSEVRYGWFDFIDDREVSAALIAAVEQFGREAGMTEINGPLGFTDFDPEGMLVEGFEELSSFALKYNFPYYMEHIEALGFEKKIDWLEYKVYVPEQVPEKILRVASIVEEKFGLRVKKITRKMVRKEKLGHKIFELINRTYQGLYDFTVLTPRMIDKYVKDYLAILDLKFVSLVVDKEDTIVGVGISMQSISRASRKANGHLFPFGWYHFLRSMFFHYEESCELLLIGIDPQWQDKGVNALIFKDLIQTFNECGFKYAETNGELETNFKVHTLWNLFNADQTKRRRIYGKKL